jgi:hypothetical protein
MNKSLQVGVLNEFYKTDIRRFTKIATQSLIMNHHRVCSMSNTKDDFSGAGTAYPAEALVQYSTDSRSTMSIQSVT